MKKLLLILILLIAMPTFAQDTGSGAEAAVQITTAQNILNWISAFGLGLASGVVGLGLLARSILNNKALLTLVEKLGDSFPPETRSILEKIGMSAVEVGEFIKEATDGKPADKK